MRVFHLLEIWQVDQSENRYNSNVYFRVNKEPRSLGTCDILKCRFLCFQLEIQTAVLVLIDKFYRYLIFLSK